MAAHETIETLSGALMSDERILNVSERKLLSILIQRANQNIQPENKNLPDAIARIVGEIVTERACGILERTLTQQMLKELLGPVTRTEIPMRLGSPPSLPPASPDGPRPPGPTPPGIQVRDLHQTMRLGSPPSLPPASPDGPRPPGPTPPGIQIRELPARNSQASSGSIALAEKPQILPAQYVLLEEFLAPEELHDLMQDTLARETEFQISEVIAPGMPGGITDFEHRRSHVLVNLGERHDVLLHRLQACLPKVIRKLGQDPFRPSRVEMQITASNDGDFFCWHCDNAGEAIASREITFVYFFHREPKAFRGGELRIYDSRWDNGAYVPTQNYRAIVPQQNQVVLFASSLAHEITPVECPSRAFTDSRFTVNGWFHR
ncbi:MAG TPA: 2OG-Fe(II) oxygenase [Terriglobales bacterium]|nr:2OG-Fe(II) oxygenase [Terriglobales bacterium]